MKNIFILTTGFFLVALTAVCIYVAMYSYDNKPAGEVKTIISLSPSVTETLYFLGLWDRVVAVTRYCEYPPEALELPKVGGIDDINYEAVVSMAPDLVIVSHMQQDVYERLTALGVRTVMVNHDSYTGLLDSFEIIGDITGVSDRAQKLAYDINNSLQDTLDAIDPYPSKTVLLSVFRDAGMGGVLSFVAAGDDGYYSGIFDLLNVENPLAGHVSYVTVTREGLYWIDPDVIVELVYLKELTDISISEWQALDGLKAVDNGMICVINESFGYVPGPRYPLLVEALAKCIYPEVF